jgi:hypothetical protein
VLALVLPLSEVDLTSTPAILIRLLLGVILYFVFSSIRMRIDCLTKMMRRCLLIACAKAVFITVLIFNDVFSRLSLCFHSSKCCCLLNLSIWNHLQSYFLIFLSIGIITLTNPWRWKVFYHSIPIFWCVISIINFINLRN